MLAAASGSRPTGMAHVGMRPTPQSFVQASAGLLCAQDAKPFSGSENEDPGSWPGSRKYVNYVALHAHYANYHFLQGNASAVQRVLLPNGSQPTLLS